MRWLYLFEGEVLSS